MLNSPEHFVHLKILSVKDSWTSKTIIIHVWTPVPHAHFSSSNFFQRMWVMNYPNRYPPFQNTSNYCPFLKIKSVSVKHNFDFGYCLPNARTTCQRVVAVTASLLQGNQWLLFALLHIKNTHPQQSSGKEKIQKYASLKTALRYSSFYPWALRCSTQS